MPQPPTFISSDPTLVCKLCKALYGLKQAPRSWFFKLSHTLLNPGCQSRKYDTSLFTKITSTHSLFLLVYVDDIIITGSSSKAIHSLIQLLCTNFSLKDLGRLHYFLGIQVTWDSNDSILLTQTNYTKDILHRAKMDNAKIYPTPMVSSLQFSQDGTTTISYPMLYLSIVGALQYLTITRPELSFSVNRVFQFMHNPQEHHRRVVKRILCYIVGTSHLVRI